MLSHLFTLKAFLRAIFALKGKVSIGAGLNLSRPEGLKKGASGLKKLFKSLNKRLHQA